MESNFIVAKQRLKIKLFFRYINSRLWCKAGHFNGALSKGPSSTTWIWNLHSDAHDYLTSASARQAPTAPSILCGRKVFSSNLAHLSLVFFWISGMHFHGAYFSNYDIWLKDAKDYLPCLCLMSLILHQDILNSHQSIPYYFQGIDVLSGIFQLWRVEGILTPNHLKYVGSGGGIATIISLGGSYFHMHCSGKPPATSPGGLRQSVKAKFKGLSIHHLSLAFGLTSIALSAHQYHISVPPNPLLQGGISPLWIPCPQDLFFKDLNFITSRSRFNR